MPVVKATVEQTVGFEPTTRSELLIAPLSTHLSYACEWALIKSAWWNGS